MKTNFLSRKVTYSLLFAIIFFTVGVTPIFSQVQIEVQADQLVEVANGTSLGQDASLPLPFMLNNDNARWRGFHSQLVIESDPNTLTADTWIYPQPSPVYEVAFQYGIEGIQEVLAGQQQTEEVPFSKRYSIRYYLERIYNNQGTPETSDDRYEFKYFRKFYYNKGHVKLEIGDEIHIFHHENSHKYMLYHVSGDDITLLECERFAILETPDSYVSKYGRHSDNTDNPATVTHTAEALVSHIFTSIGAGNLNFWLPIWLDLYNTTSECESSPCANFYDDTFSPDPNCGLGTLIPLCQRGKESVISDMVNVSVYPNPTSGTATIEVDSPSDEIIKIKIIDLAGKVVREQEWSVTTGSNLTQIDMTSAPAGVYHMELDSKYRFESQKIIIIK